MYSARALWGVAEIPFNMPTAYASLASYDAAMADYPEARKTLAAAVATEKATLATFKKDSELAD